MPAMRYPFRSRPVPGLTAGRARFCLLVLAAACGLAPLAAPAQAPMTVVPLSAGIHRIEAEVASTAPQRMTGLMNRKAMPVHHGMLFVFPEDQLHCMWMKNTLLPLSVAFLDANARIINIEDMSPGSETNHCAKRPARFALEMNRGWFAEKGIAPGVRIGGILAD